MAVTMTYASLVADVTLYLERSDAQTINQIPSFINLAESIISDELKILGQQETVTANMVQGNPVIAKPTRWRKTTSFNITVAGERKPLLLRKYEYLRNYWPNPTTEDEPLFMPTTTSTTGSLRQRLMLLMRLRSFTTRRSSR